jgi:hypothetical protein
VTETSKLGFPEAAKRLGVSIRILRQAIHDGKIPAPGAEVTAVSPLTREWLTGVQKTAKVSPEVFKHATRQKTPAFARYEGTSAWRKYRSRVREFYRAQAAAE